MIKMDFHIISDYLEDFMIIAQWPGVKLFQLLLVSSSNHLLFLKHTLIMTLDAFQ